MASLRQLQNKVKTFKDFQKVVNIQKIVVMKEIAEKKKYIEQAKFRMQVFNNAMLDMNDKYRIYNAGYFDAEKTIIPIHRDLHIILPNPTSDKLGDYGNKLIVEYIQKNHRPDDVYVAIGPELSKFLVSKGINVIKTFEDVAIDSQATYARIAHQIVRGYEDLMFVKASFIYLSVINRQVVQTQLFPFDSKKVEFTTEEKANANQSSQIVLATDFQKSAYFKDVAAVGDHIVHLAIQMKVYWTMIEYRVALAMRELQSLDDKEKNIKSEIELVKLKMQRVRKDSITNELLTNAVAFGAINGKDDEEDEDE